MWRVFLHRKLWYDLLLLQTLANRNFNATILTMIEYDLEVPAHPGSLLEAMPYYHAPDILKAIYQGRELSCGHVWMRLSCPAHQTPYNLLLPKATTCSFHVRIYVFFYH